MRTERARPPVSLARAYFETIPHDRLGERVRTKVSDGRVLALVEAFLEQGVVEGLTA